MESLALFHSLGDTRFLQNICGDQKYNEVKTCESQNAPEYHCFMHMFSLFMAMNYVLTCEGMLKDDRAIHRNLSEQHANHEDKLQVRIQNFSTITYHGYCSCEKNCPYSHQLCIDLQC